MIEELDFRDDAPHSVERYEQEKARIRQETEAEAFENWIKDMENAYGDIDIPNF